jgi:hypothetical protein
VVQRGDVLAAVHEQGGHAVVRERDREERRGGGGADAALPARHHDHVRRAALGGGRAGRGVGAEPGELRGHARRARRGARTVGTVGGMMPSDAHDALRPRAQVERHLLPVGDPAGGEVEPDGEVGEPPRPRGPRRAS